MTTLFRRLAVFAPFLCFFGGALHAQRDRIAAQVDRGKTVVLRGNHHPKATLENDRGPVEASFRTTGMTLMLKQSPAQQAEIQQLLSRQQDPTSPDYHKWLTPEQYADRFGSSPSDTAKLSAWLAAEGFTVDTVGRGRNWIQFSGTAEHVRNSFHTEIHRYSVNGEMHYANAAEPSIPAAFSDVVGGIRGLNDFHPKPHLRKLVPENTTANGAHSIVPDDIATIYNVKPLYATGIDGMGQKIVVVGQTSVNLTDIQRFRTRFNLPSQTPQVVLVPKLTDPGFSQNDLAEADLDIEWAGAVAYNATIVYVYSANAFDAVQYAVDQNLAPVISMSYGFCELMDLVDLPFFQSVAQQANAQGATWLAAAGDGGAADCEDVNSTVAQAGKAADAPAVIPEVTGVGGTEFNDVGGAYWSAKNNANMGSALSYIPEVVWNDPGVCVHPISSSGGGASSFFPKPVWQAGPGVPNDGFRDVPDVALSASCGHDPTFVFTGGTSQFFGGTSVAAPTFASMVALLNHYLVSTGIEKQPGLGNINPALYRLAQTTSGVFHDITSGNNMIPCPAGSPDCVNGFVGFKAGPGYDQASGLGSVNVTNLAHQWSSAPPKRSAVVAAIYQKQDDGTLSPVVFQTPPDKAGNAWVFTLTLNEEAGIGTTLTSFAMDGANYTPEIATFFGSATIPANGSISANLGIKTLTVPKTVQFTFGGMDTGTGTPWSLQLAVAFSGPEVTKFIGGVSNAASGQQVYAPGMIMSVYGVQMGLSIQSASAIPLPSFLSGINAFICQTAQQPCALNGVPAPLYYVSPTQLNIQIPYETPPGPATLEVDTPYKNDTIDFQVASAGPGIFTFADGVVNPFRSGARGGTYTLFITGEGQVLPSLATGTAPSPRTPTGSLPRPRQPVSMTIGGVPVASFEFIGIPPGLVGVTQINFVVPANAPLGPQQVVVTVGNAASPAAMFTVTQ
jgi:uncharacterized protein (TIGR03437 family)